MRFSLAFLTLAFAAAAHAQQAPPLFTEIGDGPIKSFKLQDETGASFTPEQLRGKVWIAHFFFTSCTQGCEKTKLRMMEIQDAIRGKSDLALVSISVNPEGDTPDVLSAYAKDMKAEPGQWFFLTGPQPDVFEVVKKSFFQAVDRDVSAKAGQQINHTFALVVVDRDGKIVGYTDGRDPENVSPLIERVRGVASERYVLPSINAALNATAGFLLLLGYVAIRRRKIGLHKTAMILAFTCSTVFLACYLYYHFAVLRGVPPRLVGPGAVRIVYLAILLSHTILAVVVAPMAVMSLYQGLKNNLAKHVKLARWTLPIWLYVSVTGVVVYAMLYHLYPPY